jgi:hypothetical protein
MRPGCMPHSNAGGQIVEPTGNYVVAIQNFVVARNANGSEGVHCCFGRNLPVLAGGIQRAKHGLPPIRRLHRRNNVTRTAKKVSAHRHAGLLDSSETLSRLIVGAHLSKRDTSVHRGLAGSFLQRTRTAARQGPCHHPLSPDSSRHRGSSIICRSPESLLHNRDEPDTRADEAFFQPVVDPQASASMDWR